MVFKDLLFNKFFFGGGGGWNLFDSDTESELNIP